MSTTMFRCNRCKKTDWLSIRKHDCGNCIKPQKCSCSGLMVQMTEQEIKDEQGRYVLAVAAEAKYAREHSTLPKWCISAIAYRAYEDGHSAGQQEVDNLEMGMLSEFEHAMRKDKESS